MNEVFDSIAREKATMSKSHKRLADYILQNKTRVSFLNITELAQLSETSEATIVRFCGVLGYKGYPELRHKIQDALQEKVTIQDRLAISKDLYGDQAGFIQKILTHDMALIESTLQSFDTKTFFTVANALISAKRICIVSGRSAAVLGRFLEYYFKLIFDDICMISTMDEASERYAYFEEGSVVLGITFPRYTKSTLRMMEFAQSQGCTTIGLTDSHLSPLVQYCDHLLYAQTDMPALFDTYVAPLTIINALIAYLSSVQDEKIKANIERAEKLWEHFDIF